MVIEMCMVVSRWNGVMGCAKSLAEEKVNLDWNCGRRSTTQSVALLGHEYRSKKRAITR